MPANKRKDDRKNNFAALGVTIDPSNDHQWMPNHWLKCEENRICNIDQSIPPQITSHCQRKTLAVNILTKCSKLVSSTVAQPDLLCLLI